MLDTRPSASAIEQFRALGVWRTESPLSDLTHWREQTPDAIAIIAHEADRGVVQVTFSQYAEYVDRFAAGLHELGVRPGQVVAVQIPNRWQYGVLLLAVAKVGAVIAPILPTLRARELERVLRRLTPHVVVTIDQWDGYEHSAALAQIAPRLPGLRHRIVLGDRVQPDEVDFSAHFERTAWENKHADALNAMTPDPDRVSLVLFTSGTSGEPKAALHTLNTMFSLHSVIGRALETGPQDRIFSPHALTHVAGTGLLLMALHGGATEVIMDRWNAETAVPLLAETGTTMFFSAPVFLFALIAALRRQSVRLPRLRIVTGMGTTIPPQLGAEVAETFGVSLRAFWGMTEGGATFTQADDPDDWAVHSIGRPGPGVELDIRSEQPISDEHPGRLFLRGSAVCLGTIGRDQGDLRLLTDHDDGWYDAGDLAVPDGRGGIRLLGRASDRIGGVFMIPVSDVESALLDCPAVKEVALVGYPDEAGTDELACAVIVSDGPGPTLADLRQYLDGLGMTAWYRPSRLEVVPRLPRNSSGKVRKDLLRRWLHTGGPVPDDEP